MRNPKKLAVLVAVFALSAIGAANASAATFTASATGSITGKATTTQTFTTNAGTVKCTVSAITGTITSTASPEQKKRVHYTSCNAFGFINTHITDAEYNTTAGGPTHILNTITITPTGAGCTQTIHPQTPAGTITYTNNTPSAGKTTIHINITAVVYTGSGGICGSGGTAGTFSGSSELERVGGGSISRDA